MTHKAVGSERARSIQHSSNALLLTSCRRSSIPNFIYRTIAYSSLTQTQNASNQSNHFKHLAVSYHILSPQEAVKLDKGGSKAGRVVYRSF